MFLMIFSVLVNYILGRLIAGAKGKGKPFLVISIVFNLLLLCIFKYTGFFAETINAVLPVNIPVPNIRLPIGISFFTFQILSYVIDVYKDKTLVQKNFLNVLLYISLFPQLIAGPIVKYYDVAQQIEAGLTSAAVIKELVYDKNNKSITVTKGNNTTSTLVMEGLAVNVTCKSENNKSIIQLLDVNNNPVGDTVELDVERFITSAEYNNETKSIILYFDGKTGDESTDKIVIPVGDLVDTYTVESTSSVDLSMVENKIKAAVKISAAANNVAIIKDDGVFVPAVDTSGFMLKVSGAVAGNVPIFDENGQIVDSGKTFAEVTGDVTELKDAVDAVKEDIQALNEAKLDKSSVLDSASMSSSSATASDESTLSEKAILTMIEWKTTM